MQIIDCHSSRLDEMEALSRRMQEDRPEGAPHFRRTIAEDRNRPGHFMIIVEFESVEEAQRNSQDPVTRGYGQQMGEMLEGEPMFYDLDVRLSMDL
jgi:hypothetical protein